MSRVKYSIDYVINSSPTILYRYLTSPTSMSQWYADEVDNIENKYSFFWEGYEEKAELIAKEDNVFVRYKMDDVEEDEYVEFRIRKSPVTGDTILIITDFADDYDVEDQKQIWNSQVDSLISNIGGGNA